PGLSATRTARGTARSTNFIFASFLQGLADQGRLKQDSMEPRTTRATRNSDSKTNETVGKFRRQASPCGQRDNSDGKTQDAGREGMVSTRGVKASHTDGSSRWQDEDAARRLSATSRTRSTVKGRNEQRRRQTEILLRVGAPGSMSVTSLGRIRCPVRRDEDLGRPRQTIIGVYRQARRSGPGRDKLSWA
ncbi:hypothetical protein A4X13_0g4569, partial [Tilletia indica]